VHNEPQKAVRKAEAVHKRGMKGGEGGRGREGGEGEEGDRGRWMII
jgi:hypothetical protein